MWGTGCRGRGYIISGFTHNVVCGYQVYEIGIGNGTHTPSCLQMGVGFRY
jgi:hypothetical protein